MPIFRGCFFVVWRLQLHEGLKWIQMNQMYDFRQPSKMSSRKTPAYPLSNQVTPKIQRSNFSIFSSFPRNEVGSRQPTDPAVHSHGFDNSRAAGWGESEARDGKWRRWGVRHPHLTLRKYREISSWPNRATGPAGSVRIRRPLCAIPSNHRN